MVELSLPAPDMRIGRQTDTIVHVDIELNSTPGSHVLYGSTTLHPNDPNSWEASATPISPIEENRSDFPWIQRDPNTTYHLAVVTTSGLTKTISNRVSITTAYPRPVDAVIVQRDTNSARVTWNFSSPLAHHILAYIPSGQPLADLKILTVLPPGEPIVADFLNLPDDSTNFIYSAIAWDQSSRISGLASIWGGDFITTTPKFITSI